MAGVTGMHMLPHDRTFFGDRLLVPNKINALWWTVMPPRSIWSANMFDVDMIAVGRDDDSLSESIKQLITGSDGSNDFVKMGYIDIQGWIIAQNTPLTKDLTASPNQIIDDYIRKIPVPVLNDGNKLSPDEQLVTLREQVGEDSITSEEGEENIIGGGNTNNEQLVGFTAGSYPSVIDQAAWYDLGPEMFFEERIYLGTRHGNAIPVANNKQRYVATLRTKFGGKATRGQYGVIIFTASMPHLHAGSNWGDIDSGKDPAVDRISDYDGWVDMIMAHQRIPLESFEMQDEINLANARQVFRQDQQLKGGDQMATSEAQEGLWGVTGNYEKYLREKRRYHVLQGTWEQQPMLASLRINHTMNVPWMLVPNRI